MCYFYYKISTKLMEDYFKRKLFIPVKEYKIQHVFKMPAFPSFISTYQDAALVSLCIGSLSPLSSGSTPLN